MTKPFYITTPIYYINDVPHLGHAYTTVACDALARYMRMRGRDVRFLTGTDEHGANAQAAADAQGVTPQRHADRMAARYREAWKALHVTNDDFIRTTDERHVRGVVELWKRMAAAGDIYKAHYRGPYCTSCESFYLDSQLVDGKCPQHGVAVEQVAEESYFFRLSAYQDRLLRHYDEHPGFVVPETRLNEVASFVRMGLQDLSISRTKVAWGVRVPDDPAHVMYVWVDALTNYISALGFGPGSPRDFSPYWPADLQVMGKDIVRFHAVYWPAFLMSAGLPPPRQVLAHGWWNKDGAKMSKTKGNIADPLELVKWFGTDATRYFLLREISLGNDGNYSEEAIVDRVNADLANDLGNTLSRVTRIAADNLGGRIPRRDADPLGLVGTAGEAWRGWLEAFERYDVRDAVLSSWTLLDAVNRLIVETEPWKLAKDPARRGDLERVMHEAAEGLRHVAAMLAPVMPGTAREIWRRLGLSGDPFSTQLADAGPEGHARVSVAWEFPSEGPVQHGHGLFPRIDKTAFFADVQAEREAAARRGPEITVPVEEPKPAGPSPLAIDEFARVALRAARVVSCRKHPQADKLLVLDLDDGTGAPRTICAGVAAWVKPEDLQGKMVAIVANLEPRKLRGVLSAGMMLAASWGAGDAEMVVPVILPESVPPGAVVR
jgi:methionyl-tRNA synthetase